MTRLHVYGGLAAYYLLLAIYVSLRSGPLNGADIFFMLTAFPVPFVMARVLLNSIIARENAERAHKHEIAMQDRLARKIALETNGPAPTPEEVKRAPIGFRMNREQ